VTDKFKAFQKNLSEGKGRYIVNALILLSIVALLGLVYKWDFHRNCPRCGRVGRFVRQGNRQTGWFEITDEWSCLNCNLTLWQTTRWGRIG